MSTKEALYASIVFMLQPMPAEAAVLDPMKPYLALIIPLFVLLTYIVQVYTMVFDIVREKESRAKETMRIMGMTDLPYWLSWFVFYTVLNTVITTLSWSILLINVINYSSVGYVWLFFWLYGQAVFG